MTCKSVTGTDCRMLYAFYDLEVAPVTFDIIKFLVLAEIERLAQNCDGLHVVIVPGPKDGFRDDPFTAYDSDDKSWRLRNLVLPCCWLMPSCRQVTVSGSRLEAEILYNAADRIFPQNYRLSEPVECYDYIRVHQAAQSNVMPTLKATPRAVSFVCDWIAANADGREVVTMTLRETSYEQARNSRLDEWAAFAAMLNSDRYYPVIVRDTQTAVVPLPDVFRDIKVFTDVSWNIELRAALYEESYVNLFQNNGPYILCAFNSKSRYINMTQANVPGSGATDENHFRSQGIEPGKHQNRWSTPLQELVWSDDIADVIYAAFEDLCCRDKHFRSAPLQELEIAYGKYFEQQLYHRAAWISELAVKRFDERPESWLMHARVLQQLNAHQEALQSVQQAVRLEESPEAIIQMVNIGQKLEMTREVAQLQKYLQMKYPDWHQRSVQPSP